MNVGDGQDLHLQPRAPKARALLICATISGCALSDALGLRSPDPGFWADPDTAFLCEYQNFLRHAASRIRATRMMAIIHNHMEPSL